MSVLSKLLVLPRPGQPPLSPAVKPVPGVTEAAFTATFGSLLPPAQFLSTAIGKAAYYELAPEATTTTPAQHRVLFLHGIQTPALGLLPLVRDLRASFPASHVVVLELWGHGLSDTPFVAHSADIFLSLVDHLLDHLHWPSVHLVGYSFGALLSAEYTASRSAGRVASLSLVAPAGLFSSEAFTEAQKALLRNDGTLTLDEEKAARDFVIEFLEGGELVVPPDWEERVARGEIVAEALRAWQLREHPGHAASVVGIFRDAGVYDNGGVFIDAAKTGVPSVVVLGANDELSSKEQFVERGLGNVVVVPDVGHAVVRERHQEVAAAIQDFWAKLQL